MNREFENEKDLLPSLGYMPSTWVSSFFCTWQLFYSPPGFAPTNGPNESINKKIKQTHTKHEKRAVYDILEIMVDMVRDYSLSKIPFALRAKPDPAILDNKLWEKYKVERTQYPNIYSVTNQHQHWVNTSYRSCSCVDYLDKAVCVHIVAVLKHLDQFVDDDDREFFAKKKSGRKPKASKNGLSTS